MFNRVLAVCIALTSLAAIAQDAPVAPTTETLTPAAASAPERDVLREQLHLWHRGERISGFVPFVGSGVASALAGTFLVTSDSNAARGGGWVVLGFGVLEIAAGLVFALSSFSAETRRDLELTQDRPAFIEREKARLKRITTLYQPLLLGVEAAVAVGGGVTAGIGGLRRDEVMVGVGLGLAVQGLIFFLLDWAVSDRANAYALALGL
ncbi:MAG: hypothetical protein JNM17_22855 [Archangium sp.]|nr:hypothetical protein [Archangium sp.]